MNCLFRPTLFDDLGLCGSSNFFTLKPVILSQNTLGAAVKGSLAPPIELSTKLSFRSKSNSQQSQVTVSTLQQCRNYEETPCYRLHYVSMDKCSYIPARKIITAKH